MRVKKKNKKEQNRVMKDARGYLDEKGEEKGKVEKERLWVEEARANDELDDENEWKDGETETEKEREREKREEEMVSCTRFFFIRGFIDFAMNLDRLP